MTRVKVGAYLGNEPPCTIEREVSVQLRNNFGHVIEHNKSIMYDNQVNQSVNQSIIKSCMWSPHQNPIYFSMD